MNVESSPDTRFKRALEMHDLEVAHELARCFPSLQKWNELLKVAAKDGLWSLFSVCEIKMKGIQSFYRLDSLKL
jgi:hypothetical protein